MTLTLRYAARSDRGLIRDGNQDSVYAGPRLLAVADGMGGMAAGDIASNIVIAAIAPLDDDVPGDALVDTLRAAVDGANQQLRDAVDVNPALEGMGTTLTAMLFSGTRFGMAHVGDSRAYLMRNGEFVQVTKDDSYVQMLVDEGRLTPEEAASHPQRSLLTRALDGRDVDPDYSVRQAVAGDRYLICSDGLSGVVSGDTIAATMREYTDPEQCVERLVQLALRGGGPDNITVVVADVTDGDIVEEEPVVGGAAARDRGMATSADDTMSSARAAAIAPPRRSAPPDQSVAAGDAESDNDVARTRHGLRTTVSLLVLLVVLGGGLYGGWQVTQSRYYVSNTDDGRIAVFQGVPGKVVGIKLQRTREISSFTVNDLTETARDRVKKGISASSEDDARRKLAELTSLDPSNTNLLPICVTPTAKASPAEPSASASAVASATVPAGTAPGAGASVSASPSAPVVPSPSVSESVTPVVPAGACRNG